jgi:Fe-S-cluster containining protein
VTTDAPNNGTHDTANIHLQMLGEQCVVEVTIPLGDQPIRALLPAARELTHQITGRAVAAAEREGRTVSCRAGCGACCRQLVVISLAEAQSLSDAVAAMPPERQAVIRQRFAEAIRRLESAGLLDPSEPKGNRHLIHPGPVKTGAAMPPLAPRYFQEQIACPFLDDESCGIYAERPLVCREYLVTSPAADCAKLYELPIARLEVPVHMGGVMVQLTHQVAGVPIEAIPLVLSLEWAEAHPGALERQRPGLELVQTLVAEIECEHHRQASAV